jgi:hypothetical protein
MPEVAAGSGGIAGSDIEVPGSLVTADEGGDLAHLTLAVGGADVVIGLDAVLEHDQLLGDGGEQADAKGEQCLGRVRRMFLDLGYGKARRQNRVREWLWWYRIGSTRNGSLG